MVFENLNKELQKLVQKRFKSPTLPQQLAIKPILEGKNILLIAQTGTGKCVSGNTLILTDDGVVPIKDLYKKIINVNVCDGNFQTKMNMAAVIRKKKSKLYSVKSATGRIVDVTDDHKFMRLKNGKISWIPLKKISEGNYVALTRKSVLKEKVPKITLNFFEKYIDEINISIKPSFLTVLEDVMKKSSMNQKEIARKIGCCKDTLIRSKKNNWVDGRKLKEILKIGEIPTNSIEVIKISCKGKTSLTIPKIDEDFAYFTGLVIGDGNFNVNSLRFTTASEQLLKKFESFIKTLGFEIGKDKSRKYDYYVCSKSLLTFFYALGLPEKDKAANVKIPNIFFSNYYLLSSVLRGIYDTDGSIYKSIIEFTTKSKILAQEVLIALSCFGVFAIIKDKIVNGKKYKKLVIQDVYNRRLFFKEIGFSKNEKMKKLKKTLHVRSNPNIDVIPEISSILTQVVKDLDVKWSTRREYASLYCYLKDQKNPTRKNLVKVINYIKKFGRKKILTNEMMFLENLAVTDIFWDKIIEIKEKGEEFVYDATVPEFKNFIGNGFILHNTESVMLPLFSYVIDENPTPISILYITPLKSLNRDLLDRLMWWGKELDIEVSVRHGDTSQYERKMQVEFPPQLLITTPETIQAILTGKRLREHLKNIKFVVVDEIHELADSKRGTQLTVALERLRELCGDFQIIGLSATVGHPERVAKFLCPNKPIEIIKATTSKAMEISVTSPKPEPKDKQLGEKVFTSTDTAARLRTIMELIKNSKSVLTFTNTREFAEILSSRIKTLDKKFPLGIHHSSLSKDVRIKTEKEFKDQKIKSIISTSSLQLGIDIGSIDLVIQYQSPRQVSQLVQRVGRSGHELDRISKGIIVSTDEDDIFESAVIARKAVNEELEELNFHNNSYDVLAHQIVGLTLDMWRIETQKAYEIFRRAYPYQKLTFTDFIEVCKQLQILGLIFFDQNITKKRRGFEYYFSQLSTIPDSKQFRVYNTLDNSFVGVLDEEFVALHGEPNTNFVLKGEAYKIISTEEDKILVEPTVDVEASIPGWEGELIPVPFEVSQEVGKLRKIIEKKLKDDEQVGDELKKLYPIDSNCSKKMISLIKKQMKYGIVPTDDEILVEDYENLVIIHSCFGSLVNETLGRFLSALLTTRIGSVGLKTDPYRIMLQFQTKNVELIKEILKTNPEHLRSYLEMSLTKSNLFEWKFVHVAKRFGAISRDADYGKFRLGKIIDSYVGSPIYKETLKELETEKLDIEKATEILKKIQSGEIKVFYKPGLSPLGRIGVIHKYAEVIGPARPEMEIFELFKQRLLNTKVRLVCVNCGQWSELFTIKNMPEDVRCDKCEARLLGITRAININIAKIIKKGLRGIEMAEEEKKRYDRIRKTADLFLVYKRKAAVALAARGVGPVTAKRILSKYHKDEDMLMKDILEAERMFIKTKKYWSS